MWYVITSLFRPMPVLLAFGRWYWERQAYLVNLRGASNKEEKIERIVDNLWNEYAWTWPKKRMRKWFMENA